MGMCLHVYMSVWLSHYLMKVAVKSLKHLNYCDNLELVHTK